MRVLRTVRVAQAVACLAVAMLLAACGGELAPAKTAADYVPTPVGAAARPTSSATSAIPGSTSGSGEPIASTASLTGEQLPMVEFTSSGGTVACLPIEVLPHGEFSIGLSGRHALGERGMLFDYGAPGQQGPFWMKNTHIDLDIAFIDDNRRVVSIRTMRAESLEYVYAATPYQMAIEAPAGWYAAHGVTEGARLRFLEPPSAGR